MKKLFPILILALTIHAWGQIPTTGLIGYWPFTGNANDCSESHFDGIAEGAFLTLDRTGRPNSAYHFNDSTECMIYLNYNQPVINSDEFTISAWAIMDGPGGGYEMQNNIFEQRGNDASPVGARSAIVLMSEHQSGNSLFILRSSINNLGSVSQVSYPSPGYGTWHHYVGVLELNDTIRLYLDGIEVGKSTYTQKGDFITDIDFVDFGSHRHTGTFRGVFNGDIDEIRIYNRALSAIEILSLFHANPAGMPDTPAQNVFSVYPNPARDHLKIEFGPYFAISNKYTFKITNSLSQTVSEGTVDQRLVDIDLSGWNRNAMYFISLIDILGNIQGVKKLIIN